LGLVADCFSETSLPTRWSAAAWSVVRVEFRQALAAERDPASMTLLADLEVFVQDHRPHGQMTGDATEPAWNGYRLTVACACGVVFERWVTSEEADTELLRLAMLN